MAKSTIELCPYTKFEGDRILYPGYKSKVIEIYPIAFDKKTEFDQDEIISMMAFAMPTGMSTAESFHIIKLERPLCLDERIYQSSVSKKERLLELFDFKLLTSTELLSRIDVIDEVEEILTQLNNAKVLQKHFYFQIFAESDVRLNEFVDNAVEYLARSGIKSTVLKGEEIAIFLKNSYTNDFDEREFYDVEKMGKGDILEKIVPRSVKFGRSYTMQDDKKLTFFDAFDYPFEVGNAWLFPIVDIDNSKVVLQLNARNKEKSVKDIDRSLRELRQKANARIKDSELLDVQSHIETLQDLLMSIKQDNDNLYDVNLQITAYDNANEFVVKREVKRALQESRIRVHDNSFRQTDAYLENQPSRFKSVTSAVGINSSAIAGGFPFCKFGINDKNGFFIGEGQDGAPNFIDIFERNDERVNSNAMVIGKSGGGKTYCVKTIETHLTTMDSIVITLDPEAEFRALAKKFGGDIIDVGDGSVGRINPFEVMAQLQDSEDEDAALKNTGSNNGYYDHLNFLAAWFEIVLDGIGNDALQFLDNAVNALYENFGINGDTDLSMFNHDKYPIFDDLYNYIKSALEEAKTEGGSEYEKANLRQLETYLRKFSSGGRYSGLWNGYTSIQHNSRFIDFDFRSLLANSNSMTKNAQMTLVLRLINQEIIKNLEYNKANNTDRKIIIVIEEVHVFIDSKFMIALDFIKDLAKRIRKYGGALIVSTQNVKDLVQTGDIAVKASAIINNCQYSLIFRLAENDINDLCELYRNNPFNDAEIDSIKKCKRGEAFLITTPQERTSVKIIATKNMSSAY